MKTLGIVGGIGPESTIEYYRFILDGYRQRVADGHAPHIIIDSIDVNRAIAMLDANDLVAPADTEKAYIHDKYINELLQNRFLPETRDRLLAIIGRMRSDDGIEGVVLAGTELPLLLRGAEPDGLVFLDTTLIHVERAIAELLGERGAERA